MKKPTAAPKSKPTAKKAPAPVKKAGSKAAPVKKAGSKAAPVKKSTPAKVPAKKPSALTAAAKSSAAKKKPETKIIVPAVVGTVTTADVEAVSPLVAEASVPESPVQPVVEQEAIPAKPDSVGPVSETPPVPAAKGKGKSKKEKPAPAAKATAPEPVPAELPKPADEVKPAKPVPTVKPLVCLLGDEALVKDFSAFFQTHNIPVIELKNLGTLKTNAKKITAAFELTLLASEEKTKNLKALDETLPAHVPVAVNSITATALMQTHHLTTRERFIGIAAFPTLTEHALFELAPSLHTTKATLDAMEALLASAKKETALVQDGVGMVMPRILCQIINEALFTVQADVATPHDIDEAMKHGTNYPAGPIAWGERIGFATVAAVLDALHAYHQEERYRTAPLLRQLAVAGVFWKNEKQELKHIGT